MTSGTVSTSFFGSLQRIPKDAIFALTAEYIQDTSSKKVNLGQGTYRDEKGQPWVLPSVLAARERLAKDLKHEYLPILGHAEFLQAAAQAVLGQEIYESRSPKVCFSSRSCHSTP
jgi:aspartate aminotransferase, cytoplasmic